MGMMMGPGGMGNLLQVVQNPEFLKMMDITPEQVAAIRSSVMETLQRIPPPSGEANFDQRRQWMEQMVDGVQAEVEKVLKPEQRTKLKEVTFQLTGGLNSLNMPFGGVRALETLELTAAQKEQVKATMEKRDAETRAAMQGFNRDEATPEEREKFRAEMAALNKKYADQVADLLTPEQKAKAENLTKEASVIRETLGIPAPGQRPPRGADRPAGPAGGYTPGADSWRPGQAAPPTATPPAGEQRRRGGFPREE
jgi:Spy/CpxP family protein refolding chaperone